MPDKREYLFAEVLFDKDLMESFADERGAHFQSQDEKKKHQFYSKYFRKLNWHINHSLSKRQKEVIGLIIKGKTEREIGAILGISQQVVNIYKWRAIIKLRQKIKP